MLRGLYSVIISLLTSHNGNNTNQNGVYLLDGPNRNIYICSIWIFVRLCIRLYRTLINTSHLNRADFFHQDPFIYP